MFRGVRTDEALVRVVAMRSARDRVFKFVVRKQFFWNMLIGSCKKCYFSLSITKHEHCYTACFKKTREGHVPGGTAYM